MKKILSLCSLMTALLVAPTAQAGNYYSCSTESCSKAGSTWTLSSYAKTRYPIVLAHGMGGFDSLGPIEYFYGIPGNLSRNGASVYITTVASFDNSTVRGEQLLKQIKTIQAITGASKVNIIGHSQGTLDARYVAGVAPQRVASMTGVGGPNTGSPVADLVTDASELVGPELTGVVGSIVNGFFDFVNLLSGATYEQDSLAGLAQLTAEEMAVFNARFPGGMPSANDPCGQGQASANGVRYYSWSGTGVLTNALDISDYPLGLVSLAFGFEPNDGLVGRCSSHLGMVVRDNYFMNHLDEVNMLFGLRSLFEADPVTVFRQHANRLKNAGL